MGSRDQSAAKLPVQGFESCGQCASINVIQKADCLVVCPGDEWADGSVPDRDLHTPARMASFSRSCSVFFGERSAKTTGRFESRFKSCVIQRVPGLNPRERARKPMAAAPLGERQSGVVAKPTTSAFRRESGCQEVRGFQANGGICLNSFDEFRDPGLGRTVGVERLATFAGSIACNQAFCGRPEELHILPFWPGRAGGTTEDTRRFDCKEKDPIVRTIAVGKCLLHHPCSFGRVGGIGGQFHEVHSNRPVHRKNDATFVAFGGGGQILCCPGLCRALGCRYPLLL